MSTRLLDLPGPSRRWLLVIAAPKEWRAIASAINPGAPESPPEWTRIELTDRFDAVLSGVGKANAAGAAACTIDPARHAGVLSLGIAGALPGPASPAIGARVLATTSVMADEGVRTPDSFIDIASLGFPPTPRGMAIPGSPELLAALAPIADFTGPIATVSACAGADDHASALAARTGAIAEAMEGAAVGLAAHRILGPDARFAEVRVISNTTGDRARQIWDLAGALHALGSVARAL